MEVRLGFTSLLNVFDSGLSIVLVGSIVVSPYARIGKNRSLNAG